MLNSDKSSVKSRKFLKLKREEEIEKQGLLLKKKNCVNARSRWSLGNNNKIFDHYFN